MQKIFLAIVFGFVLGTAASVFAVNWSGMNTDIARAEVLRDKAQAVPSTISDAERDEYIGILGDLVLGK